MDKCYASVHSGFLRKREGWLRVASIWASWRKASVAQVRSCGGSWGGRRLFDGAFPSRQSGILSQVDQAHTSTTGVADDAVAILEQSAGRQHHRVYLFWARRDDQLDTCRKNVYVGYFAWIVSLNLAGKILQFYISGQIGTPSTCECSQTWVAEFNQVGSEQWWRSGRRRRIWCRSRWDKCRRELL